MKYLILVAILFMFLSPWTGIYYVFAKPAAFTWIPDQPQSAFTLLQESTK